MNALISQPRPDKNDFDLLEKALKDPSYTRAMLERDVGQGGIAIYRAFVDGQHMASVALRIDSYGLADELVIVAVGGNTPSTGQGLYKRFVGMVKDLAQTLNCVSIRSHATGEARDRLMKSAGWIEAERVYRIEV